MIVVCKMHAVDYSCLLGGSGGKENLYTSQIASDAIWDKF